MAGDEDDPRIAELVAEGRRMRAVIEDLGAQLAYHEAVAVDEQRQLKRYAADLRETFKAERARTRELHRSYMSTVRALANAVEARDAATGRHAERVAAYALVIASEAGLDLAGNQEIEFGFLLHDIGKVAVPDAILFKPGKLTSRERLVIERHPVTGATMVSEIDFLGPARDVIRHHHERWDGDGYPDRFAGVEIPLSARVFAVADVLDALTTERPYRRPSPLSEARARIEADAGSHFDPAIIEAYGRVPDAVFEQIRRRVG
jgi:ribonuclease P protein subunit RPR2